MAACDKTIVWRLLISFFNVFKVQMVSLRKLIAVPCGITAPIYS